MQGKRIADRHMVRRLFMLCWVVYFVSYLARLNYAAVMSELIGTVLTKGQAGWIGTAFLIAYAGGQLLNGMLAERIDAKSMIACGLLGGAVCSILFPFSQTYGQMMLLRFLTGYCMSALWPPILQVFARKLQREDMVRSSVHIASSMAAGSLASYLLCAWMLRGFSWRAAFYVPGALLFVVAVLWFVGYSRVQAYTDTHGVITVAEPNQELQDAKPIPFFRLLLLPGILALFVPTVLHGVLKDGVTAWIPTYITEVFSITPAASSLIMILLPIVNLSGAYMAQQVHKRVTQSELRGSALFFAAAAIALVIMVLFGTHSLILTLVLFAVITSSMLAINTLLVSILPLRYQNLGRTATLSGMLNAIAYGGSAAASGIIGMISARWGWNSTVLSWLGCMLLALAFCIFAAHKEQKRVLGGSP